MRKIISITTGASAWLLAGLLASSTPVYAQQVLGIGMAALAPGVDTASGAGTSQVLSNLQARIQVLQAEAQIAKLEADIATSNADAVRGGGAGPVAVAPTAPAVLPGSVVPSPSSLPRAVPRSSIDLMAVDAFDGQYRAVIASGDKTLTVGLGDPVPGGWTVSAITDASVTLKRGRETMALRN